MNHLVHNTSTSIPLPKHNQGFILLIAAPCGVYVLCFIIFPVLLHVIEKTILKRIIICRIFFFLIICLCYLEHFCTTKITQITLTLQYSSRLLTKLPPSSTKQKYDSHISVEDITPPKSLNNDFGVLLLLPK